MTIPRTSDQKGRGVSRPSFQFYHGDWRSNAKLRRCTPEERGIWMDVMCLFADGDEFGLLRWPLVDLAQAAGCKVTVLNALRAKGVLKGSEGDVKAYNYTPRHAGRDGEPVVLIPAQVGPIWYSSRMVRDDYLRTHRGEGSRFAAPPKPPPTRREGVREGEQPKAAPSQREGYGPSSSSSSSSSESQKKKEQARSAGRGTRLSVNSLPESWAAQCKAERPDLNPEATFKIFRDHWIALPGAKGVKLDWEATWRNWIRREASPRKSNGGSGSDANEPPKSCALCHGSLAAGHTKRREGLVCNTCEATR